MENCSIRIVKPNSIEFELEEIAEGSADAEKITKRIRKYGKLLDKVDQLLICIERFWRSIKYEEIYLNEYKNMKVLNRSIENYINRYNQKRLHSAIDYQTPNEVYYQAINNLDSKGAKLLPQVS